MKNILFLFAAASLILATGCEEPEPEKTAEPQIFDFQVPEEEIEAFSARIIITCSDESLLWYYGLALSSDIAEDPDFAENARQSLLEYVKIMGGSYSLTDLLYPGDYVLDRVRPGLEPSTAYTPYAFGLDENGEFTTEIHYGPEFTTDEIPMTDLSFDLTVKPGIGNVVYDIAPSDKSAYYLTAVIDDSWYEAGLDDSDIAVWITEDYAYDDLYDYVLQGDITGCTESGLAPDTRYYVLAWGVDMDLQYYNSEITKEEFHTKASQPTGAYAEGHINHYWHSEDIYAYNPDYKDKIKSDPDNPLYAPLDIVFNESAASCIYIIWDGDITGSKTEEEIFLSTISDGYTAYPGDPAPIFFMSYNTEATICIIGIDADGNYGDMFMDVIVLTEEGTSHDYALFDKYFNDTGDDDSASAALKSLQSTTGHPVPAVRSLPTENSIINFKSLVSGKKPQKFFENIEV